MLGFLVELCRWRGEIESFRVFYNLEVMRNYFMITFLVGTEVSEKWFCRSFLKVFFVF